MATTFSQLDQNTPEENDNFAFDSVGDGNTYRATLSDIISTISPFGSKKINTVSDLEDEEPSAIESLFGNTPKRDMLGYNSVGDGGGGPFYWDADRDKQDHDGGEFISPTHSAGTFGDPTDSNWYDPDPNDIGTGCWVRDVSDGIKVAYFGVTSDILNIKFGVEAAVNAMNSEGDKLIFSSQNYTVSETVDMQLPQHSTVIAEGSTFTCTQDDVAFHLNPDLRDNWDESSPTTPFVVRNITWRGGHFINTASIRTQSAAIVLRAMRVCRIQDCRAEGFFAFCNFQYKDTYWFKNIYTFDCIRHYYTPRSPATSTDGDVLIDVVWDACHMALPDDNEAGLYIEDRFDGFHLEQGGINGGVSLASIYVEDGIGLRSQNFSINGTHIEQVANRAIYFNSINGQTFEGIDISGEVLIRSSLDNWTAVDLTNCLDVNISETRFFATGGSSGHTGVVLGSGCEDIKIDSRTCQFRAIDTPAVSNINRSEITIIPEIVELSSDVTQLGDYNSDLFSDTTVNVDILSNIEQVVVNSLILPPKGYNVIVRARDSNSGSGAAARARVQKDSMSLSSTIEANISGLPNDYRISTSGYTNCQTDGSLYFDFQATGTDTLSVWIQPTAIIQ